MGQAPREALVRFWRVIELASLIVAVVSFVVAIAHGQYYLRSAPAHPEPDVGRIFAYSEHGRVVYITKHEKVVRNTFFVVAWFGTVICLFVDVYKHPFSKRRNERIGNNENS